MILARNLLTISKKILVLSNDKKLCHYFASNAYNLFCKKLDAKRMTYKYEDLYLRRNLIFFEYFYVRRNELNFAFKNGYANFSCCIPHHK